MQSEKKSKEFTANSHCWTMSNYVSKLQTKKKFIVLVFRTVDIKS